MDFLLFDCYKVKTSYFKKVIILLKRIKFSIKWAITLWYLILFDDFNALYMVLKINQWLTPFNFFGNFFF